MKTKHYTWRLPLFLSLIFFILSLLTLKDYGISWDEILHFSRGQAYLYYFLTGKTNYKDLPNINLQGTFGYPKNTSVPRRSFFQLNDFHNGDYFIYEGGGGHPPINDDLAALSNYIFFQKLGILDDVSSYHLFNIVAAALLVFVVVFFALETLGVFPTIVSFLALCTYPLFWAESHFNIKDPPETAFFAGFIWAFYKSLKNFSVKWLALSILFFSLGLGTKFNILFAVPIIVFYFIYQYRKNILKTISSIPKGYIVLLFLAPLISLGILTISWPFLWHNWFYNFLKVINYYKGVGTAASYQPSSFYILGFNTFPILWILFTTPPAVLFLGFIGILSAWLNRQKKAAVTVLWLIWFIVPILRVSLPGTVIYGGVRQIIEFLPAMALLCALGVYQIGKWTKNNMTVLIICVLIFIWPIYILVKLHPNENVYFNFLIGGLKGAQSRNFPSWGNSFGNAYFQGIKWINQNVPQGSKLSLIQGTLFNVPPILVRKDINFSLENWSGISRGGEYLMDLTFNDTAREFNYEWEYLEKFLVPVYELKVDDVSILKIWKNDLEHTKEAYRLSEVVYTNKFVLTKNNNLLTVDLGREVTLSRVNLDYLPSKDCFPLTTSFLETSMDGTNWVREKDRIPYSQVYMESNVKDGRVIFFLAGKKASFIRFWFDNIYSCGLDSPKVTIRVLKNI